MISKREDIRNVAIIAHVDHGKTTLVDGMLRQSGIFRDNESVRERVMDSNDLERERGITILSKNTAVNYKGVHINIVDTPGHADFGGEVERILKMVNGVLLLVDAFEGPMPQTRFVLKKALQLNLKPIVVINKIDRPDARPEEVVDEVLDLFIDLEADENQLDFSYIYASSREGFAVGAIDDERINLKPLFDIIIEHVPPPEGDFEAPLQMLVSSLDYDEYIGRIAIGRVERGSIKAGQQAILCKKGDDGILQNIRITRLYKFDGLKRIEIQEALVGDIIALAGIPDITIGETVCDLEFPEPLPFIDIDEPTMSVCFSVNNGPFAGLEGQFLTTRHLRDRLFRELETNLSLRVEETDAADTFKVSGRGELHLSILIETMRRQGYEFQISKPEVINKTVNDELCEPYELLVIDIPEQYTGVVMEKLGGRKAQMLTMHPASLGYLRLEFRIPARGLIGYRTELLTDTKGTGIMNHLFDGYDKVTSDAIVRQRGAIVAWEDGDAVAYGLYNAQERGNMFIHPGTKVYEGMIVGENARNEDITINVCKKKHITNMRASGSEETLRLVPPIIFSLEQSLEFIAEDELLEVTPSNLRLRKRILNSDMRAKSISRKKPDKGGI